MKMDNHTAHIKQEWNTNSQLNGTNPTKYSKKTENKSFYSKNKEELLELRDKHTGKWDSIKPEYVARMRVQNRFKTGIDIAKYTSAIMRADMDNYDNDPTKYTQSLGCWHGFIGQQKMISIKKHFSTNKRKECCDHFY